MKFSKKSAIILVMAVVFITFVTSDVLNNTTHSNDLMRNEYLYSMSCNHSYNMVVDHITTNFKTNIKACKKASQDEQLRAEFDTSSNRNFLAAKTDVMCILLSQCKKMDTAEEVYDCYIEMGNENIEIMNQIKTEAAENLSNLREKLREVKTLEQNCINEAKLIYDNIRHEAYSNFTTCMGEINIQITQTPAASFAETKPSGEPEDSIHQAKPPNKAEIDALKNFEDPNSSERTNNIETSTNSTIAEASKSSEDPESSQEMENMEATTTSLTTAQALERSEVLESFKRINNTEATTSSTIDQASKSSEGPESIEKMNNTEASTRSRISHESKSSVDLSQDLEKLRF